VASPLYRKGYINPIHEVAGTFTMRDGDLTSGRWTRDFDRDAIRVVFRPAFPVSTDATQLGRKPPG
jgi:hypothetical protein